MLLVTFHQAIDNVVAYDTSCGEVLNTAALSAPTSGSLDELRALVLANNYLYVADGGKSASSVLCYALPTTQSPDTFAYVSTVIAATFDKKGNFETSISHPFGIAFDGAGNMYVSNQDTNVVAQVALSSNNQTGTLGSGCQSAALTKLFPSPPSVFLDGTYVASQNGTLHGVAVTATDVPQSDGGLGVSVDKSNKPLNSVRDVAIANGLLIVCDEVDGTVNLYSLADGSFISATGSLSHSPTHLAIWNDGVYVSAGTTLYWSQLPASATNATLSFQAIALTVPAGYSIGGISFDPGGTQPSVYIPFQKGKGTTGTGSIYVYDVTQSSTSTLPVLSNGAAFGGTDTTPLTDTPEFVLFVPDPSTT